MSDFYVIKYDKTIQYSDVPRNSFILSTDDWDDYGFVTMFHLYFKNEKNHILEIGETKISFRGQKPNDYEEKILDNTYLKLPQKFETLDKERFFSLGQSPEFYETFYKLFEKKTEYYLARLNDLSNNPEVIDKYEDEPSLQISLLRSIDVWQIKNQFNRIIKGGVKLDNYIFAFVYSKNTLNFDVVASSNPPTNIHALIGKNGVGKTSILNSMFNSLMDSEYELIEGFKPNNSSDYFIDRGTNKRVKPNFFSKSIFISYSIFGNHPPQITDNNKFAYLGLKEKNPNGDYFIKNIKDLTSEFFENLKKIYSSTSMKELFLEVLNYFNNSYDENILNILKKESDGYISEDEFLSLSSGHSIVLLVIVNLIANAVEKTLVLFDEPETHLHPPLLSALIRAVNDILIKKNGVCIFATHSPVVLQEIPKDCVYSIFRKGDDLRFERPNINTFGENVSTLTHEVFSLEVKSTGFYNLLTEKFDKGDSLEKIKKTFDNKLGSEALSLLYLLEYNSSHDSEDYFTK